MPQLSQLIVGEALNSFLLVYAALFSIVNPVSGAPVFLNLTRRFSRRVRQRLAGRVALNGFLLLLGSLFVGSHVLEFFGLTLPVVRVAGGLVVTSAGWTLLNQETDTRPAPPADAARAEEPDAFYPLTLPLTVGPGSITVAITLGSQRPQGASGLGELALIASGAVAGILAIALTIYVCYRFADRLEDVLGRTGTNVMLRLSAFILVCIGIQICWAGISALIASLHT
ncbi:MAG TPA: MarC family protein [Stellaceae bacterium]|nr:MarC family protein [Stellaceae bacterium]